MHYCHAHLLECSIAVTILPLVCPQRSSRVPPHPTLSPSKYRAPATTLQDPQLIPSNSSFPFPQIPPPAHKLPHQTNAPKAAVDTVDYLVHCGSLLYQINRRYQPVLCVLLEQHQERLLGSMGHGSNTESLTSLGRSL